MPNYQTYSVTSPSGVTTTAVMSPSTAASYQAAGATVTPTGAPVPSGMLAGARGGGGGAGAATTPSGVTTTTQRGAISIIPEAELKKTRASRLQIEQQIQKEQRRGTLKVSVGERRKELQEQAGLRVARGEAGVYTSKETFASPWTVTTRLGKEPSGRRTEVDVRRQKIGEPDITQYFRKDYEKFVVKPKPKEPKPTYIYKEPVQETRMDMAPVMPFGVTIPTQFEKAMGKGEPEKGLVRKAPSTFTELLRKTYEETEPSEFKILSKDIGRGGVALATTLAERFKREKPFGYLTGAPSVGAVGGAIGTFGVRVIGAPIEIFRKPVTSAKEIFYEFPKKIITKPMETFREERKAFTEEPAGYTGALVGTYYTLKGAGRVYRKTIGVKPVYEKIEITKGKTYDVFGLQRGAGAYPLISKTPEGYLEFGRPKIDIISQLRKGKIPETPLETALYLREAKKLYPTEEYGKIKAVRTVVSVTEKVKSKFIGTFPKETKTLTPKGTKIVREFAKKEEAEVYGSYGAKAQMPAEIRGREVPTPSDIDIQTILSEAETIARTKKLAEKLKASGENVRVSPRKPTLIESYDPKTKTYHHAVDIHSIEAPAEDILQPSAREYAFGFKLMKPTEKIEGIKTMPLREQAIRKGASAITLRKGGVAPAEWRGKDIPHFVLTEMTLLESMKGFSFDPFRPVKRAIGERALARYQELVGDVGITGEAVKIQIYKPTAKKVPAGAYPPITPYIKPSPKITPSLEVSEGISPFISEPISPYIKPSPKVSEPISPFVSEPLKPSPKISPYVGVPSPKVSPTVETVSPKVSVSVAEAEPSPALKPVIPTKRRPSPRIRARKYGEYVITDRYGYEDYPKEKPKITKTYFYPRIPPAVTETTKIFGGALPKEKIGEKKKGIWGMISYQLKKYAPTVTAIEYGKTIKKTPYALKKVSGIEERPVSLEQLRRPRKGLVPTLQLFEKKKRRRK